MTESPRVVLTSWSEVNENGGEIDERRLAEMTESQRRSLAMWFKGLYQSNVAE